MDTIHIHHKFLKYLECLQGPHLENHAHVAASLVFHQTGYMRAGDRNMGLKFTSLYAIVLFETLTCSLTLKGTLTQHFKCLVHEAEWPQQTTQEFRTCTEVRQCDETQSVIVFWHQTVLCKTWSLVEDAYFFMILNMKSLYSIIW